MDVKFWGTRGSIPSPLSAAAIEAKLRRTLLGAAGLDLNDEAVVDRYLARLAPELKGTVGGETPCLEVRAEGHLLILDAGSGLRHLGDALLQQGFATPPAEADFLMSHTHWDHIQGFPFFKPAFITGNRFNFYSPMPDLEQRFRGQQASTWFPVSMDYMAAEFNFITIDGVQAFTLGPFHITPLELSHPGRSWGYRIVAGNRCLVYATDSAYETLDQASNEIYVDFFREADLLVFDAHFSFTESVDKPDWGHSTALVGAEFAYRAGVKRLALFHHAPDSEDERIHGIAQQAQAYLSHRQAAAACDVLVAQDGLSLTL